MAKDEAWRFLEDQPFKALGGRPELLFPELLHLPKVNFCWVLEIILIF